MGSMSPLERKEAGNQLFKESDWKGIGPSETSERNAQNDSKKVKSRVLDRQYVFFVFLHAVVF